MLGKPAKCVLLVPSEIRVRSDPRKRSVRFHVSRPCLAIHLSEAFNHRFPRCEDCEPCPVGRPVLTGNDKNRLPFRYSGNGASWERERPERAPPHALRPTPFVSRVLRCPWRGVRERGRRFLVVVGADADVLALHAE